MSQKENTSLADAARQTFIVLVNAIIQGQNAEIIRAGEPEQLAKAAWSMVHGLSMLLIDGQIPIKADEAIALSYFVTHTLMQGLAGVH